MNDNAWILPVLIIGSMVFGMTVLFTSLVIFSRKASRQPGESSSSVQGQTASRYVGTRDNAMSKSGAVFVPSGTCNVRFSDVAGCDEAKAELQEIVQYLSAPHVFESFGAKLPKGVLLVGPPGTGKTLLAKACAGESRASFLSISGPNFVEMFVGVGAARVRDLFAQARKNVPCIIFIDEIDAVGRRRSNTVNSNDERESTLNQLLVELDGFSEMSGVVILAATNRSDILDPALIRPGRFDRHITVDLPDVLGRQAIFAVHTSNKPVDPSVSFEHFARLTPGLSGADIESVCNEAATLAARRVIADGSQVALSNEKILKSDFDEGLLRVQVGIARGSRKRSMSVEQLFNTAVHEVGHGWVSEAIEGGFPVSRITVLPRGNSLGHTSAIPENDSTSLTDKQLKARLSVLLAGRLAQQEILGVVDSGAVDDFAKVADLARQYVVEFGMSELGPIAALGNRGMEGSWQAGSDLLNSIDEKCRTLIEECQVSALEIVRRDAEKIRQLSGFLAQRETLMREEWLALKAEVNG